MKLTSLTLLLSIFSFELLGQTQFTDCQKLGFETKNGFLGWTGIINREAVIIKSLPTAAAAPASGTEYISLYNASTNYFPTSVKAGSDNVERFKLIKKSDQIKGKDTIGDPFIPQIKLVSPTGSDYIVRLGNSNNGAYKEGLKYSFIPTEATRYVSFWYAVVLEEDEEGDQAYFYAEARYVNRAQENTFLIPCSDLMEEAFERDLQRKGGISYRKWTKKTFDFSNYIGQEVEINLYTSDCPAGGHFGYAYIDGFCTSASISYTGELCTNKPIAFTSSIIGIYEDERYSWDFGDGTDKSTAQAPSHAFAKAGTYTVSLTISRPYVPVPRVTRIAATSSPQATTDCGSRTYSVTLTIKNCVDECKECVSSFSPIPKGTYLLSAWVKEKYVDNIPDSYTKAGIKVAFNNIPSSELILPSGPIIDGWQRIEQSFTVPEEAKTIQITLENTNPSVDAYFDDIRIHPFNSNMKSFVYDLKTQKLIAELDENNYATHFQYDDEGQLIRVTKETERGVLTVKENRTNQSKISGK